MIKKYNQFLLESSKNLTLLESIEELSINTMGDYYSVLSKSNRIPSEDFKEFQSILDDYGWTLERIRKENTDEELIELYRQMDSISGIVDIYFYKLFEELGIDKDIVKLGGDGWSDISVTYDEAFIRYSYGYHNTEYGLLSINQIEGGLNAFFKAVLDYLFQWIQEDMPAHILSIYTKNNIDFYRLTGFKKWNSAGAIKMEDYLLLEDDRIIIYVNDIANYLNNKITINGNKLSDYLTIKSKDIYDQFKIVTEKFGLDDIDFTGSEVIIWGNFAVD
jgi:hypothetical protein